MGTKINEVISLDVNLLYICFVQGKCQWNIKLPDSITALELLDYQSRGVKAVVVATRNKEIRIFRDQYLVHLLQVDVSLRCIIIHNLIRRKF